MADISSNLVTAQAIILTTEVLPQHVLTFIIELVSVNYTGNSKKRERKKILGCTTNLGYKTIRSSMMGVIVNLHKHVYVFKARNMEKLQGHGFHVFLLHLLSSTFTPS